MVVVRNCGWLRDEIQTFEPGKGRTTLWQDPKMATPVISSHALAKDHLAVTTFRGELLLLDLAPKPKAQPFRFQTPHGKPIASSPAISKGCVFFGCDDGYLYVLGPGGSLAPKKDEKLATHVPKSKVRPATVKAYGWTSLAANAQATNFVDDPGLKPPLRLRWATRAYGHFKTPCVATEDGDVLSVTFHRLVTCQEQATGRLRWRVRLPEDAEQWDSSCSLLADGGRIYVPVPNNRGNEQKGRFLGLDQNTGGVLWSAEIGRKHPFTRGAPVVADGKVAFSYTKKGTPPKSVIQAWDAATGTPAWEVEINASAENSFGASDGRVFYFSAANQYNGARPKDKPGETVAIEAKSGKVLWRSSEAASGLQISLKDDKLYLYDSRVTCVSAKDGAVIWKGIQDACGRYISIGPDYYVLRGYAGHAWHGSLADGAAMRFSQRGAQLGGDCHACGPVALTPNLSINATVAGLHVRDAKTGGLVWLSPGFAPRACVNPSLANGRVFWPSAASGMVFCWEPQDGTP
jgi:outer membrane protein assembly factor BamB